MQVLVTGSSGLIGAEAVIHYDAAGHRVDGIDTAPLPDRLHGKARRFLHHNLDIRDRRALEFLFKASRFDLIIHCAARTTHHLPRHTPLDDFETNAVGTLNLLEMTRRCCPDAVFVFVSTFRVYGNAPNALNLVESETRFDFADAAHYDGISESCTIDQSRHGILGASKAAADLMVQEYGCAFGLRAGVFRVSSVVGPRDSAPAQHGFLARLARATTTGAVFNLGPHAGKRVRDPIHTADLLSAFDAFYNKPHGGEVYNLGGGRDNSVSPLEAIAMLEDIAGTTIEAKLSSSTRATSPTCYITDTRKLRTHYPNWRPTHDLPHILEALLEPVHA